MKISKTANKRTAASRSVSTAINLIEKHSRLKLTTLKVNIVAGAAARALRYRFDVPENIVRGLSDCDVCSSLPSRRRWRRQKRLEKNFALLPVVASLSGRQLSVSVAESFEDTIGTLSFPLPSTADIPRSTHEQSPRRWPALNSGISLSFQCFRFSRVHKQWFPIDSRDMAAGLDNDDRWSDDWWVASSARSKLFNFCEFNKAQNCPKEVCTVSYVEQTKYCSSMRVHWIGKHT